MPSTFTFSRFLRPAALVRPVVSGWFYAAVLALAATCAGAADAPQPVAPSAGNAAAQTASRLDALLPADVLLVGEQHDAKEHQQLAQQVISILAKRDVLAAVALEMAEVGTSTADLTPEASAAQVREALHWNEKRWPWANYEAVVMTAVREDGPVLGANLPRSQFQDSIGDRTLDARLPGPTLKGLQQAVRIGHCNLLPEDKVTRMTRIQIARDITMADTVHQMAMPGMVVVLLAGNGHVDRGLGVPLHLRNGLKIKTVNLHALNDSEDGPQAAFDATWTTPALPARDRCAELQQKLLAKKQ